MKIFYKEKYLEENFLQLISFCLICCVLFIYLITRRSLDLAASAGNENYHHLHI